MKSLDDFYVSKKKNRPRPAVSNICKPCHLERQRASRAKDMDAYRARTQAMRDASPEYRQRAIERTKRRVMGIKADPEKYKKYRVQIEGHGLKRRYGMTRDELQRMLAQQNESCLICRCSITWDTRNIDHIDTSSGPVVRGILCASCNTSLGKFKDDPAVMRRAADYVERWDRFAYALGPIVSPDGKAVT